MSARFTACQASVSSAVAGTSRSGLGEASHLSPEALAFIGMDEHPRRPSNGWRSPGGPVYEDDREELSAEDSAMLSALMNVPRQDQLEFVNIDWF
jgi:hypothetical protein